MIHGRILVPLLAGGMLSALPKPVTTFKNAEDVLQFGLDNEAETIRECRPLAKQVDRLNAFAMAETTRGILLEGQEHMIVLATALGIDPSKSGIADTEKASREFKCQTTTINHSRNLP